MSAVTVTPAEIWRTRVTDRRAVIHGAADVAVHWELGEGGRWRRTRVEWELGREA